MPIPPGAKLLTGEQAQFKSAGDWGHLLREAITPREPRGEFDINANVGSFVGDALKAAAVPGQLIRGGMAGRPGERVTADELLQHWGNTNDKPHWAASLGLDVATDPLNFISAGLLGGAKHVQKVNPALRYGRGVAARRGEIEGLDSLEELFLKDSDSARSALDDILDEIPPGSKRIGDESVEARAFQAPDGHVIRISQQYGDDASPVNAMGWPVNSARPEHPHITPSFRNTRSEFRDREYLGIDRDNQMVGVDSAAGQIHPGVAGLPQPGEVLDTANRNKVRQFVESVTDEHRNPMIDGDLYGQLLENLNWDRDGEAARLLAAGVPGNEVNAAANRSFGAARFNLHQPLNPLHDAQIMNPHTADMKRALNAGNFPAHLPQNEVDRAIREFMAEFDQRDLGMRNRPQRLMDDVGQNMVPDPTAGKPWKWTAEHTPFRHLPNVEQRIFDKFPETSNMGHTDRMENFRLASEAKKQAFDALEETRELMRQRLQQSGITASDLHAGNLAFKEADSFDKMWDSIQDGSFTPERFVDDLEVLDPGGIQPVGPGVPTGSLHNVRGEMHPWLGRMQDALGLTQQNRLRAAGKEKARAKAFDAALMGLGFYNLQKGIPRD